MTSKFYIIKCLKCGVWSGKEIRTSIRQASFKCKYCNKSYKLKHKNKLGILLKHVGPFENPNEITPIVLELNKNVGSKIP